MLINSGIPLMHAHVQPGDDPQYRELDLSVRRNMEVFFRLLDWPGIVPAPLMELRHDTLRILIAVEGTRLMLTLARTIPLCGKDDALHKLAGMVTPEAGGLPIRVFRIDDDLHVSCTLPEDSGSHVWLRIFRNLQQRLRACGCSA